MSTATTEVKKYIIENFASDVQEEDLTDDYDLLESGLVNSLGLLRLISWLGERFDIAVDEVDISADAFRSVAAIRDFIEKFGSVSAGR
jgi:acyl carrier protein